MKKKLIEGISESELNLLKEYGKIEEYKHKIHNLLKKLVIKSGIGEVEEGWGDDINFIIGDYTIYSCGYYSQLTIQDDYGEHELDRDLFALRILYNELKKREQDFEKIIQNRDMKTAIKVFDKPIMIKFKEG